MNKYIKTLVIASALNVMGSSAVLAETSLTKAEVKSQAVEACKLEATKRFGADSIKYVSSKTKWEDDKEGASVKMKIKTKLTKKFSCVLQKNNKVKFYKA